MDLEIWLEPFAGGAGAALHLLESEAVSEVWLVDAHPGIAAFWTVALEEGEQFARRVERTLPTLTLFRRAQDVVAASLAGDHVERFELAYATFIVNRCSRSGIVTPSAGPIGGKSQSGRWKVGSRFNAQNLAGRIRHVHSMRLRLRAHQGDGIAYLEDLGISGIGDEVVAFVDPPYVREGPRLYTRAFDDSLHRRLAAALNKTPSRWILTYDNAPVVADELYSDRRVIEYTIRNSANTARQATELLVLSDSITLPSDGPRGSALGMCVA